MYLLKQVDAIDYYSEEELKYRRQCEQEKVDAFQDALGIAFVSFENDNVAAKYVPVSLIILKNIIECLTTIY